MTSTNGVTLEGDDITKILSKLEASLKAKAEEGEEKGKASPEPGLVSTLSVVAIAMCCVFAMILLGLGLLVQYKKHVNPRSLIQGKMKTSLV